MASAALAQEHVLTVKETLGGIFVGGELGTAVAKAANPAAKPILYKLLDKPQMKDHHKRIYLLFRYIGDNTDAEIMEKRLKAGDVDWADTEKVLAALVTMSSRGVSKAGAILERMTRPDYWQETKFAAMTNSPIGMTNELAIWAIFAYAGSGKSDWGIKVKSFKNRLSQDIKARGELEWRLDTNRISQHVQEFRHEKAPPISPEFRKLLSQLFNGDMDNPGPATDIDMPPRADDTPAKVTVVKTLTPKEIAPLKIEAINAFNTILDAFVNDRHEQLALTLADNGKPLAPIGEKNSQSISRALETLKRLEAENNLKRTKELIQDLQPHKIAHGEPTGEILSDGTIVVRIPCLGSEPVTNKHFGGLEGIGLEEITPTIDQDRRLYIYMLKQGNHWYWNPFGW